MLAPAPAATPFTAHTTGLGRARNRRTIGLYCTVMISSILVPGAMASARSCPALKARPSPVSRMARTAASSRAWSRASMVSSAISRSKLFSLSGRLSVMVATPSATV